MPARRSRSLSPSTDAGQDHLDLADPRGSATIRSHDASRKRDRPVLGERCSRISSRRCAKRVTPSRHAPTSTTVEPVESEDRELFEIACFTEGLTANPDDPIEWLDRMGRGKGSNRLVAIIGGLNNNAGPRLVATFTLAAPPLRRMMESTAASYGLATPPQDAGGREVLNFLSELLTRLKCPSEEEYIAALESLTAEEGRELAEDAVVIAEVGAPAADPDFPRNLLLQAGCFVPGSLNGLLERVRRLKLCLPAFLTAPPSEPFGAWLQSAVRRNELEDYDAKDSGWDVSGDPRILCSNVAYAMIPTPEEASIATGPLAVFVDHEGRCGICREHLTTLFGLDLRDNRLGFLQFAGKRLRFAYCEQCVVNAPTFTSINGNGRSRWIPGPGQPTTLARWVGRIRRLLTRNPIEPFDPENRMPRGGLQLGPRRRALTPRIPGSGSRIMETRSSVACHAGSKMSASPRAPAVPRTMAFIGQVDRLDLHFGDGILYAFLCGDCKIAATGEQMT